MSLKNDLDDDIMVGASKRMAIIKNSYVQLLWAVNTNKGAHKQREIAVKH